MYTVIWTRKGLYREQFGYVVNFSFLVIQSNRSSLYTTIAYMYISLIEDTDPM